MEPRQPVLCEFRSWHGDDKREKVVGEEDEGWLAALGITRKGGSKETKDEWCAAWGMENPVSGGERKRLGYAVGAKSWFEEVREAREVRWGGGPGSWEDRDA